MIKKLPKVLVGCPVSSYKDYILWKWIEYIKDFSYPNYEVFLCDNSQDINYYFKIKRQVNCTHIDPIGMENREYMAKSNEKVRRYAMENNFDYFLNLECDIMPPKDIIQILMSHQKSVVCAPYFTFGKEEKSLMLQRADEIGFVKYKAYNMCFENTFIIMDGSLKRVFGAGTGCVLMHRSAFSKIKFNINPANEGHADSFLYLDLYNLNIPVYVDTSLVVDHYNSPEVWDKIKNKVIK